MKQAYSHPRDWLVDRARQVIAAGNARHVVLKHNGHVVVQVPLAASVAGLVPAVLLAPELTVAAVILGLAAKYTVTVEQTAEGA
jgi:hypothetical protein